MASRLTEKMTFEPPERMLRRFSVEAGGYVWYDHIIQRQDHHRKDDAYDGMAEVESDRMAG